MGLRELGYTEERDVVLETGYPRADPERLPDLAAGLLRRRVDVIVASGFAIAAAQKATTTMAASLSWLLLGGVTLAQAPPQLDTQCRAGQRTDEFGCSILARITVPNLPAGPLFWHIAEYLSRETAMAHTSPASTVAEALTIVCGC